MTLIATKKHLTHTEYLVEMIMVEDIMDEKTINDYKR